MTVITTQTALASLELHAMPSSKGELRSAYRRQAKLCHPDAGGDKDTFIFLQDAFDFLSKMIESGCVEDHASVDLLILSETATRTLLHAVYPCPNCAGSNQRQQCPECRGWGGDCKTCRGVKTVPVGCPQCNGTKLVNRELDVRTEQLATGIIEIDGQQFIINSIRRS